MNEKIKQKIAVLPTDPGVYLFKADDGSILYIGKARNLRQRVRSYFQSHRPRDAKTEALVRKVADIEYIVTNSEMEALILENSLIKKHRPRYNIQLRDDKSYPYIRITNEPFPRVFATRTIVRDGSRYFGPYTDARQLRSLLKTLRMIFPFRSCKLPLREETIQQGKYRVCLDYQIQRCDGPCEGLVSAEEYQGMIQQIIQVLKGRIDTVAQEMKELIERLAREQRFEEAARWRDRYQLLMKYAERQTIVTTEPIDRDVWGIAQSDTLAAAAILKIRDGRLIHRHQFLLENSQYHSAGDLIQAAFEQFYLNAEEIPDEIFLPAEPTDLAVLESWLKERASRRVRLFVPKRGDKFALIQMAQTNAAYLLQEIELHKLKQLHRVPDVLLSLQRDLRLPTPPRRIECFDNSHLQGSDFVSALIVFVNGKPRKAEYRKYHIQTAQPADDYQAMREVVYRRYRRLLEENQPLPDLIVIDGGKGQLHAALDSLQALQLTIPTIGLAKRLEEIFLPNQSESLLLPRTSSSLRLLQQIRNEAHRFAVQFHRTIRNRRIFTSELLDIAGVGPRTAQKLLQAFGSIANIQNASQDALQRVVGKRQAERIYRYFHPDT